MEPDPPAEEQKIGNPEENPEENQEEKPEENQEANEKTNLLNQQNKFNLLVDLEPPILRPAVDLYNDEIALLRPLETSGNLGRKIISLNKPALVREETNIIGEIGAMFSKDMKVDGIYTKGAKEITYNMQKL